jgi:hypothetical protein
VLTKGAFLLKKNKDGVDFRYFRKCRHFENILFELGAIDYGRGFDSDPGRKKKGYILSRDSEVTLSHWSLSIELVIMPLIDL